MSTNGVVGLMSIAALYYLGHFAYQKHLREEAEQLFRANGFGKVHVEEVGLPIDALLASKTEVTLAVKSGSELITITMNVVGNPLQSQVIEIPGDQLLKLQARRFIGNLLRPKDEHG